MEWLKKNGALALGIGLPILLVVFFVLASALPAYFVDKPQYDVLYLVNNGYGAEQLRYEIQNNHVTFSYAGIRIPNNLPKLYRYSAATGTVQEITLHLPDAIPEVDKDASKGYGLRAVPIPLSVPEVENLTINNASASPDGYQFRSSFENSPGIMGLFLGGRGGNAPLLVKNGYIIKLPTTSTTYYSSATLVGWVMP